MSMYIFYIFYIYIYVEHLIFWEQYTIKERKILQETKPNQTLLSVQNKNHENVFLNEQKSLNLQLHGN